MIDKTLQSISSVKSHSSYNHMGIWSIDIKTLELLAILFKKKKKYFLCIHNRLLQYMQHCEIRVITKLPNSEQSYKGKVKTHKYMYINRQNQSTTGKL